MINKIEELVLQSKNLFNNDGASLREQAFVNYLENELDMNVIEVKNLGDKDSYADKYEITAEKLINKKTVKYLFHGTHYDFNMFGPKENSLILIKVFDDEYSHEIEKIFYMVQEGKKDNYLLNNSPKDLVDGIEVDNELEFLVELLKDELSKLSNFEYHEDYKKDLKSFKITLSKDDNNVLIARGFSNAIHISLKAKGRPQFSQTTIIFREVEKEDLINNVIKVKEFLKNFLNNEYLLNGKHNIYELISKNSRHVDYVNTNLLINGIEALPEKYRDDKKHSATLLDEFQIGDFETYEQVELKVKYNFHSDKFIVNVNYLFQKTTIEANSVDEVTSVIDDLSKLLNK